MIKKGSEILIDAILDEGIDTIFAYPGASIIPILDYMYDKKDVLTHYLTADEQGATHAADGYARSTGNVGTVLVSSGPGSTNAVTAIATAYFDSIPLVVFTGQVQNQNIGSDSFQECDIVSITMPITKYSHQVKDVEELQLEVRKAYRIATSGRPGPVVIDLPKDIQLSKAETISFEEIKAIDDARPKNIHTSFNYRAVEVFAEYINKAERPLILAGGGIIASDTSDILRELTIKGDIPVVNSLMGQGIMDSNSRLSLGHVGMHGHKRSNYAMRNCDLLITLGARFSDRVTAEIEEFAKNAKIIQVDIDHSEIDKIIEINYSLHADLRDFMPNLLEAVEERDRSGWIDYINENLEFNDEYTEEWTPRNIIKAIKHSVGKDSFIATDVGQHQMWVSQFYGFDNPRQFVTSGGFGTMGFGLGAAIGTQIANPEKRVVLVTGDGSFRMNMNELVTVTKYKLPIVIIILNNGVLGMVRQWQTLFQEERYYATELTDDVDFIKLADAFNIEGRTVSTIKDLEQSMKDAFDSKKAMVINALIDKKAMVFPIIPAGGSYEDAIVSSGR
ncbi:MAG: biosynthetic-type acetolactate synthase large subunit [Tissierellia bacterium]|jgi:acetolactate synthase-1/2/3 large subunit|nr:biosynthetic-type acetolactate synthase large subunit [Tissierellia bacterium]